MNNTMQHFRAEYDAHVLEHRCPAKVCEAMIRYRVSDQGKSVDDSAKICPVDAFEKHGGKWQIDDVKCIRCHACKDVAPDDIVIEDRYTDAIPLRMIESAQVSRAGG